jgi:dTDP-4-amino-4,6-dideoxygalactose transaminase
MESHELRSNDCFFDVYQNYVIRAKERDKLVAHLEESGIEILVSWPKPMHHHEVRGLSHFHLPKTEQISNEVLSLPMYPELTDDQVEFVIEVIHEFYEDGL